MGWVGAEHFNGCRRMLMMGMDGSIGWLRMNDSHLPLRGQMGKGPGRIRVAVAAKRTLRGSESS